MRFSDTELQNIEDSVNVDTSTSENIEDCSDRRYINFRKYLNFYFLSFPSSKLYSSVEISILIHATENENRVLKSCSRVY